MRNTWTGRRRLSAALLARLAPSAQIQLLATRDGIPLKLGRSRRYASAGQRDAARALYGGCGWPHCPAPWRVVELHHVIDFNGPGRGRTDDDNLVPLCPEHHHAITHGQWCLRLHPDRSVEVWRRRRRHRSTPRARQQRFQAGPDPPAADHTAVTRLLQRFRTSADSDAVPLPF